MLGELLEYKYGPTRVNQQGALWVPELVTARTLPLRTREISLACAIVTYAFVPRVTLQGALADAVQAQGREPVAEAV